MTKKITHDKPKSKGPRRKHLDQEKLKEDLSKGLTKQDAYKNQDIGRTYAHEIEKKDAQVANKVKEGVQEFLDREVFPKKAVIVSAFWQKIAEGDTSAIIYGMKTIVGLKESRTLEVSGEVSHVHSLSPEERHKRIQELRKELEAAVDVEIVESNDDPK
jgi:hypothetical protein